MKIIIKISFLLLSLSGFSQNKEPIKTDTSYYITGSKDAFILLKKALENPDIIQVGQFKLLINWISNFQAIISPKEEIKTKKQ